MKSSNIIFLRKDKQPLPFIIISFMFLVIGIFLIASSSGMWLQIITGVLLLAVSALVLSSKTDIFYDAENNTILTKRRILTKLYEKSEALSEIHYIAVVKVKTSQNLSVLSISTQISDFHCNLNFVFKNSKIRFLKLCSFNKEEAFKKAKEIAEKINVPILDSTSAEKKWL